MWTAGAESLAGEWLLEARHQRRRPVECDLARGGGDTGGSSLGAAYNDATTSPVFPCSTRGWAVASLTGERRLYRTMSRRSSSRYPSAAVFVAAARECGATQPPRARRHSATGICVHLRLAVAGLAEGLRYNCAPGGSDVSRWQRASARAARETEVDKRRGGHLGRRGTESDLGPRIRPHRIPLTRSAQCSRTPIHATSWTPPSGKGKLRNAVRVADAPSVRPLARPWTAGLHGSSRSGSRSRSRTRSTVLQPGCPDPVSPTVAPCSPSARPTPR